MGSALKDFVKVSLWKAGYYGLYRRLKAPREKRLLVLMYHDLLCHPPESHRQRIGFEDPTASQFDAHLRVTRDRYRVVALKDAIEEIRSDGRLKEDSLAITFDDGYESFYSIAYPLLQRYRLPATVFLTTEWINGNMRLWWDDLRGLVTQADLRGVTSDQIEDAIGLNIESMPSVANVDLGYRRRLFRGIESHLRDSKDEDCHLAMERLERLFFPDGSFVPPMSTPLTWEQVREMTAGDVDFEAHTCNHINIRWADTVTIEREIERSKSEIEDRIQRPVRGFAYPYGKDLTSYVKAERILRDHGFLYACNAYTGNNDGSSNLYSLHRGALPLTDSPALIGRDLCLRFVRNNEPIQ